jgi:hypothetical protein
MTATSEIASSLRDIPVTIQAGNHGALKQSNSISNHFPIGAPVAHRPRRAQRGLPTNAASRVLNLGNRWWIFFKHAKNRAAGQKNSRFADQFAKYCRHVCCAFEHREVAAGGERSPRAMSRTKVFRMAMGQRKHEEQTGVASSPKRCQTSRTKTSPVPRLRSPDTRCTRNWEGMLLWPGCATSSLRAWITHRWRTHPEYYI